MDIKFFGSTEGKTRSDRITNKMLNEVGIQHLLRKLEEKKLQRFCNIKRMVRTWTQRGVLELHLKERDPWDKVE